MEQNQPRIPPSTAYQSDRNLARQPYPLDENREYSSLPEDANVVPIKPRLDGLAEDVLTPRSPAKRKSAAKGRAAGAKQKSTKPLRQIPVSAQHPYAGELSQLEARAERINKILAERAQHRTEHDRPLSEQTGSEQTLSARDFPTPASSPPQSIPPQNGIRSPESSVFPASGASPYSPPHPAASPYPGSGESVSPQRDLEAWQAAEELRQLQQRGKAIAPDTSGQTHTVDSVDSIGAPYSSAEPFASYPPSSHPHSPARSRSPHPAEAPPRPPVQLRRLRWWHYLEVPRKPRDRIGDAALWIAVFALVRLATRYVLAAFPLFSPLLLVVMLAPAALALYLAFCVPKAGWVPIYRLFLITVGLLVGGKL